MKLAFYKAFCKNATLLDNVIGIATAGSYSHVEGVFSDGKFFSISPRENEIRFKSINENSGNWKLIDLNYSIEDEENIRKKCEEMSIKKYDYAGAVFSITPFCPKPSNKTFCSRLWANILKEDFDLSDGCKYSPNELYRAICSFSI